MPKPAKGDALELGWITDVDDSGRNGGVALFIADGRSLRPSFKTFSANEIKGREASWKKFAAGDFVRLTFTREGELSRIESVSDKIASALIFGKQVGGRGKRVDKGLLGDSARFLLSQGLFEARRWGEKDPKPQKYLHPGPVNDAHAVEDPEKKDEAALTGPAAGKGFGFVPDLSQLQPGDLILIETLIDKPMNPWVQLAQSWAKPRHGWRDARWHHAVVYVGEGRCCEANFELRRITDRDFNAVYGQGKNRIRARRPLPRTADVDSPKWDATTAQRAVIAMRARDLTGHNYDLGAFLRQALHAAGAKAAAFVRQQAGTKKGLLLGRKKEALTCSFLYAEAYRAATGQVLSGATGRKVIVPAVLSASDEFVDIELKWLPK